MSHDEMRVSDDALAALLYSAEQIADGLCGLMSHIYDLAPGTKDGLAAANALGTILSELRHRAEEPVLRGCKP